MSERYPGGIISKTAPTPTGPYENGTAPGIWSLEQQMQYQQQGIWPTAGLQPNYIEDVFSTYLYTGNDTVQTITNGIDLSTKGGAVFIKSRNLTSPTVVYDTDRGINKALCTNLTNAQNIGTLGTNQDLNSFNTNGFAVNLFTNAGGGFGINNSAHNLVSWTFRKQPKFFDVVTYTGNATSTASGFQVLNHSLASAPGCIIVKATSASAGSDWYVWHRTQVGKYSNLNYTSGFTTDPRFFNNTSPTSTTFTVGDSVSGGGGYGLPYGYGTNENGVTYVAYLFAHDAGGFGLSGTDNVISCGSYTGQGGTQFSVSLGYEPQWVMVKPASAVGNWTIVDVMRGMVVNDNGLGMSMLRPNLSNAESAQINFIQPTSTGFTVGIPGQSNSGFTTNGADYIYIAIRRGPMKVPTSGTSVFAPVERAGTGTTTAITGLGFTPDIVIAKATNTVRENVWFDRLRGAGQVLSSVNTSAENADANALISFDMNGVTVGADTTWYSGINSNNVGQRYANWFMKRAPSFFDEVCSTATATATLLTHNLGVAPEMIIEKNRSTAESWRVYHKNAYNGFYGGINLAPELNGSGVVYSELGAWIATPTSTQFYPSVYYNSYSGSTYVHYLFSTCAGVSKVGSYTGTGALQTVDCGFTTGARFVLIRCTTAGGGWYVWDSARGIVAGNDPYLLLNSTAAEVTSTDYIDTYSAGFEISSTAPAAINASGGTFIFLAIA